jgi:predicted ABC-type ATPase
MPSPNDQPQAIVIGGPNGAGKTTAAPILFRDELHVPAYVNADVIAQGLSGFAPEAADRQAGEILLQRLSHLQDRRESFAFETALAGRGHAQRIRDLIEDGYDVHSSSSGFRAQIKPSLE